MSQQQDDEVVSAAAATIADPRARRQVKLALLDKVRAHPSRERIVPTLLKVLADEDDPDILLRLIETLAEMGDSSAVKAIRPYLRHTSVDVVRAAMRTMLALDVETAAPMVADRLSAERSRVRQAALNELLRVGRPEAMSALEKLSLATEARDRKIALACLIDVASDKAQPILIRMFHTEDDPNLLEQTSALLPLMLQEDAVELLYELRGKLHAELEMLRKANTASAIHVHKLDLIAEVLDEMFRNFRIPQEEIARLEDRYRLAFERDHGAKIPPQAVGDPRSTSELHVRLRRHLFKWRARLEPLARPFLGAAIAVSLVMFVSIVVRRDGDAEEPHEPGKAPRGFGVQRDQGKPTHSLLGEVGDPVRFEGEVISVTPDKGQMLVLRNRALAVWVTTPADFDWQRSWRGATVVIEGRITEVKGERGVSVTADVVRPPTQDDKYYRE